MGIFSKPKNKDELTLVFNIGSSSVGGVLFLAQKSGIPKIIFSAIEQIPVGEKFEIDRFLSLAIRSLQVVVNKIYEARLGAPKKIFCVLSSSWCVSQTRIIDFKKNTPFIFTEKLADELIQKEIKLLEEEHLVKYANNNDSIRAIELKNIQIMLNGYETSNPLNQKTRELKMTIFISLSGEQVLKKIENTIGKHFHLNPIKFSSFALASFTIVRDLYVKQDNFLLVDIGGEMTDIFMVKKNVLRESVSFPLGLNFFTRGVALDLGCTLSEADSLISLFKDRHAEESTAKKLSSVMKKLRAEWLKKFQESLSYLSNDISIPSRIFLVTDKYLADFFRETIKNEQFGQYTLTESKFEISFLDANLFHDIAVFRESMINESSLIVDSIYINRFLIKI